MASRYKEPLNIVETGDSPRYYTTSLTSDNPTITLSISHKVRYGDKFDELAHRYYNTPTLWWYIAKANGYVNGSFIPKVGTTITIPKLV
jgi:nucleoid-associated protein YgaU